MSILHVQKGTVLKLSDHFVASEFKCPCGNCGVTLVSTELVHVLEMLRSALGKPIVITSGYRCRPHNKFVGGAIHSMHPEGLATDIRTPDFSSMELLYTKVLEYNLTAVKSGRNPDSVLVGGLGRYENKNKELRRLHIDLRITEKLVQWTKLV